MKYKRGTFVNVPNKNTLLGKPAEMQSVFFWLCAHANDDGVSFPSRKRLASECGVNIKTLDKYLEELILLGMVNKTSRKREGSKENITNLYQIMVVEKDLEEEKVQPSAENGVTPSPENGAGTISSINYNNLTTKQEDIFNLEGEIEKLLAYDTYWLNILGVYLKRKGVDIRSRKQLDVVRGRYVKVAKELTAFDREQIIEKIKECEKMVDRDNKPINWTLETVLKQLTK